MHRYPEVTPQEPGAPASGIRAFHGLEWRDRVMNHSPVNA